MPLSHLEQRSMIILKFKHEVYLKYKATIGLGQVNLTTPNLQCFQSSRDFMGDPKRDKGKEAVYINPSTNSDSKKNRQLQIALTPKKFNEVE